MSGPALPLIGTLGSLFVHPSQSPPPQPVPNLEQSIPEWLRPTLQNAAAFIGSQIGRSFPYPGQLQVGMSPLQQQAYADIGALAGLAPMGGGELAANIAGMYVDPTQNPIVQNMISAIQAATNQQLADQLRALHGRYSMMSPAAGMGGSSGAQLAESDLIARLLTGEQGTVADLLRAVYGQERQNQMQSVAEALGLPVNMQAIGAVPPEMQVGNIARMYQDWLTQYQQMMDAAKAAFGMSQGLAWPTTYQPQFGPNPMSTLTQGLYSYLNQPTTTQTTTPVAVGGAPDTGGGGLVNESPAVVPVVVPTTGNWE